MTQYINELILITGGTASGKSKIANTVFYELNRDSKGKKNAIIVSVDNYYKDFQKLTEKEKKEINWDNPDSIRWDELISDITDLLNNKSIFYKNYSFEESSYKGELIELKPAKQVILEGLFAMNNEQLMKIASYSFFIKSGSDIRFIRRLERDRSKRYNGLEFDDFKDRWLKNIKPMHDIYIEPKSKLADIIINNTSNSNKHLDLLINVVKKSIEKD